MALANDLEEDTKKPIKVYARVRPLNDEEVERDEQLSVETFDDGKKIKILDKKHSQETTYYFDGVFAGSDPNEKVYQHTTKHLLNKLLNGMNCALLTYGQTGSGKTYTLMADGCITEFAIIELFRKIETDKLHKYKTTCSFVQVYLEKVYDLLNPQKKEGLPVREHPKKGVYVSDLSQHVASSANDVFQLLHRGKMELITAETKMVRQSSRSHSIFQLCIERRRDTSRNISQCHNISTTVKDNEPGEDPLTILDDDVVLRSKMDICDLAGSERLGKTMVEGINRSEARYINSSLLQLGNVIYALSEGKRRHVPFRNSILTRLLQQCLGSRCQTSFIVCVAPSSSEAYETRCSLNFGTRARTITNKERMNLNVEVDYKLLAKKLTKKIELLESELVHARPIRDFITSSLSNLNLITSETQTDPISISSTSNTQVERNKRMNDIMYLTSCCQNMDIILETSENFSQAEQSNHDYIISKTVETILTTSTNALLLVEQQWNENALQANESIMLLIKQCSDKLESMKDDIISLNISDKNDFYAESSYCLSEACTEVEILLKESLNNFGVNAEVSPYESICDMVNSRSFCDSSGFDETVSTVEILLKIMQLLQIPRVLLEQPYFLYDDGAYDNDKQLDWMAGTTVDTVSLTETVIDTSTEESYTSESNSTMESKKGNNRDGIQFLENENSGRMYPPLKVKLNRSHSFKFCNEIKESTCCNFENAKKFLSPGPRIANYIKRKRRVQSLEYPRTKTKRFVCIDDGSNGKTLNEDSTKIENNQLKAELVDMEKRLEEISASYKQCIVEKEAINEKLLTVQQEKMNLKIQKQALKIDFYGMVEKQNEKENINHLKSNNKIFTSENSDHNEVICHLQKLIKEKEDQINYLEDENQRLAYENKMTKNENKNNIDELISAREALTKHEEKSKIQTDLNLSLADDICRICGVLESVKQETTIRSNSIVEDIASLESELYVMIEGFVRYEDALNEINDKATYVINKGKMKDQIQINDELIQTKTNKKCIGPKVITTRSPSHISKKVNVTKKNYKRQIERLKREFSEQSISAAKEIKSCRATRIKELVLDKINMNERISFLEKELLEKETAYSESKKHIELLVQELGQMDVQLNKQRSMLQFSRQNTFIKNGVNLKNAVNAAFKFQREYSSAHDMSEIPDLDNTLMSDKLPSESSVDLSHDFDYDKRTILRENEKLSEEIGQVNKKCVELERQLTSLSFKKEQNISSNQVEYLLQRKIDYLTESNNALTEEIKTIKSTSRDRKFKLQELRDRNNNLIEEMEVYKRQISQMQARFDTNRLKLEKRIGKMKEKITHLETDNKKLENELVMFRCTKSSDKSFNDDSGLPQDDSEYE